MEFIDIAVEAGKRWQHRQQVRDPNYRKIREGRAIETESPERIKLRLKRLSEAVVKAGAAPEAISTSSAGRPRSLVESIGLERVLGRKDFLDITFLEIALAVSRFVGRINIRSASGRSIGYGTGFMVSPRLLMTNNHVLASAEVARYSEVEFDYQNDRTGRSLPVVGFSLDPDRFFMTDEALDFALVAVNDTSAAGIPLRQYGWLRLIGSQGKALLGESLNIIQHPRGEPKQLVLRSNHLVDLFDQFAHYVTDTEPGSSGSPVYNDQWELVALHHSGVPKTDAHGNYLSRNGGIWRQGDDPDELDWAANEGIRISSLVEFIKKQALQPAQEQLRDELLNLEPSPVIEVATGRRAMDGTGGPTGVTLDMSVPVGAGQSMTIPLSLHLSMGKPQIIGQPARQHLPIPAGPGEELRRIAMAELEAAKKRPYYDEKGDKAARDAYYLAFTLPDDPAQSYSALNNLLLTTHADTLSYTPSRHVYPWVDLQPGNVPTLRSIYSGKAFDPVELIEADLEIDRKRAAMRELLVRQEALGKEAMRAAEDFLEASLPYNCEHVVPQSWFSKREPMRGDLHHLFACESGCNSFRSNIPYFDFQDFGEAVRSDCGKREEGKFEPRAGKGPVARATLYFLLRYPGHVNRSEKEYTDGRIATLLLWHRADPPTEYERHRNAAIHEKQGNRNPLIDFPAWAERIDFARGLG